ncbi:MAG TPA: CoA transferase, partial [Acidimicrobiales bacterium]|nr:CoA transferase [Acidimicrobiales bacterium]
MSGTALLPLDPELVPYAESGMPEGALPLATERALRAAELASVLLGTDVAVDALSVALVLHLPEVMAASYGSYWWPTPPPPRPAPGGGWYNAELGSPENAELFARLSATLPPDCDATAVAAAAQEWRLPVCDYRPGAQSPPWRPGTAAPSTAEATLVVEGAGVAPTPEPSVPPPLSGLRVLDLTSMWAGPLATWLLARLGADVVKIEPAARPDGFRARHGRGVWPAGRARRGDGSESAVFNALNSDKRSWAVDAYDSPDWLAALARSADLVVDSFSPRVMGQIGLDPVGAGPSSDGGAGRAPLRLSMPAFPPGPIRQWVAYGTGVHALSGLGHQPGDGVTFRSPGVTYPDPLAGLQGAVVALAALSGGPARNACGRE